MPTVRLPLEFSIQSRKADPKKDAKIVNAYKEASQVIKRPGLQALEISPALPVDVGQGVFAYVNNLYACINNAFYKITPAGVSTSIGTLTGTVKPLSFTSTFNNNYLFFHNETNGYNYSASTGLNEITSDQLAEINIVTPGSGYLTPGQWVASTAETLYQTVYNGSNVYMVTVAGTSGTTAPTFTSGTAADGTATLAYIGTLTSINPSVTISGSGGATATTSIDTGSGSILSVLLTNRGTGYSTPPTVTIGTAWAPSTAYTRGQQIYSGSILYTVVVSGTSGTSAPTHTSGTATNGTVTLLYAGIEATATSVLNFFPTDLVPGVSYLDTYVAVMTKTGQIYTCNPGDSTTWNALNYISSNSQPDLGKGLTSHLNYVVAFNEWSTQFFYDTGNSLGSPLLANASANLEIGCANGNSIAKFEQTVVWVGQSNTAGKGVYLLNGLSPDKISDQYVEKYLDADGVTNCTGYGMKYKGHSWYVLTLPDTNITLVFDLNEKIWTFWTSVYNNVEQYFVGDFFTSLAGITYIQDRHDGELYKLDDATYTDSNGPIYVRIVSPLLDADTKTRKFINRVEVIGDQVNTIVRVRHSDNDYQNWSMYRSINMSDVRPVLYQNGTTRRRAYELFQSDNQPLRLSALELDLDLGTS